MVQQKYKKNYFHILFEDNSSLKLHNELILTYSIKEGMEINQDKLNELRAIEEKKEAYEYAYLLLASRSHSEIELQERLKRKKFSSETLHSVIKELKEKKIINDLQFGKEFAESRIKNCLLGQEKIITELMEKGIEEKEAHKIIQEVLRDDENLLSEEERAYQALLKRAKQIKRSDSRTLYRRLYEHLVRKGFSFETVEKVLNRHQKEGGAR
ncbi:MAG: regulatory protein RecX [Elusimicrobia bacterium]|nr:regulatory protein RecX [Elusimicrobiota bacterium]